MQEKAYSVYYTDYINSNIQSFNDLEEAMLFAEREYQAGWDYIKVYDFFGSTVVEFEN